VRPQLGVGHLFGERHRRGHEDGRLVSEQRVERGDAQPHQVWRRREVGLVAHAARRIEAHLARSEKGAQVCREIACGAIVARDHERRPLRAQVDQRGEEIRAQARRDEGALGLFARSLGQRRDLGRLTTV
jgi:hypothetical protein